MTKAARKAPVKKPVSKEKEALAILQYIVENVDQDTYHDLCGEGQKVLRQAADLVGKTGTFAQEIEFEFDNVVVKVVDHTESDEYDAVIRITNRRTQIVVEQAVDISSYWD